MKKSDNCSRVELTQNVGRAGYSHAGNTNQEHQTKEHGVMLNKRHCKHGYDIQTHEYQHGNFAAPSERMNVQHLK